MARPPAPWWRGHHGHGHATARDDADRAFHEPGKGRNLGRARRARIEARDRFGIDPETFDRWATDVMRLQAHYPTSSEGDVRELFEPEGFRFRQLFTVDGRITEDPRRIRVVAERI